MVGILFLGMLVVLGLMIVVISSLSSLKTNLERLEVQLTIQLKMLREEVRKGAPTKEEETHAIASVQEAPTPVPVQTPLPLPVVVEETASETAVQPGILQCPTEFPRSVPPPDVHIERKETAMDRILSKMWNWIVVGEEFRRPGIPAEYAIATAWLVRIGIIVVVMAVGFGLQLSIKRGVLGPAGRVASTLICGSFFIGLGLRNMSKQLQLLGQGFVGGGLAMFYFAFFAASMMFKLMPLEVAFGCMIGVTAAAVVIAVRFNALSVAVLGSIGGYLTPLMIRTSEGNLPGLSGYLLLLALGMLGVALWRQWPLLTWLSFFLNAGLFSTALMQYGTGGAIETTYIVLFFVLYSTAMVVYPVLRKIKVTPLEIAPLFLNVLVSLAWGWRVMYVAGHPRLFLAFLALGMAAFYVAHIWAFLFGKHFDRSLLSAFIALVVILIGVALPLLFTGSILSTVLALQALAFLWLGCKLESRMFIRGAICLYLVVVARLMIGFFDLDSFAIGPERSYLQGLKDRVAEFMVPILSIFLAGRCFSHVPVAARYTVGDAGLRESQSFRQERMLALVGFYTAFIIYITLETLSVSKVYAPGFVYANLTLVWCMLFFHLMMMRKHLSSATLVTLTWLTGVAIIGQWFFFGWMGAEPLRLHKLCHHDPFSTLTALPRLLATLVCGMALLKAWSVFTDDDEKAALIRKVSLSVVIAMGFLYLTFEAATFCDVYVKGFRQGVVSIVWGCYGLSLIVGGLHVGKKAFRMVGLILFAVTLFKIFLIDLAKSDILFRLIAFALVGVVLLLAAYAYLRKQDTFKYPESQEKNGDPHE